MSAPDGPPPLRCTRCGGEVTVVTSTYGGYYRELTVDSIACVGQAGQPGCGARWSDLDGAPMTDRS